MRSRERSRSSHSRRACRAAHRAKFYRTRDRCQVGGIADALRQRPRQGSESSSMWVSASTSCPRARLDDAILRASAISTFVFWFRMRLKILGPCLPPHSHTRVTKSGMSLAGKPSLVNCSPKSSIWGCPDYHSCDHAGVVGSRSGASALQSRRCY